MNKLVTIFISTAEKCGPKRGFAQFPNSHVEPEGPAASAAAGCAAAALSSRGQRGARGQRWGRTGVAVFHRGGGTAALRPF